MLDFDYSISTKVFFGRNNIERVAEEIHKYADRILLVYGERGIKARGLYEKIVNILNKGKIIYKDLPGVKPNPSIESVREGIVLCKEHKLEFILAVGGGSVIDCAKAIAAGFYYLGDTWDLFIKKKEIKKALSLGTVLTLAATGSEMNGNSVISNEEREEKLVIMSDLLRPKFSFLDPTYTFTVSKKHTSAGIVDMFSHTVEQYFSPVKDAFVQDRLAEGIFKTCVKYGAIALAEPKNYEARANLLWTSSFALNGLLGYGKTGDWSTHYIEHELSAIYDITHGVGLAILTPYWMSYVLSEATLYKFVEYSRNVWDITGKDKLEIAREGIKKTRDFFKSLEMPASLREVGIDDLRLEEMARKAVTFGELGSFRKLNKEDVLNILKDAY